MDLTGAVLLPKMTTRRMIFPDPRLRRIQKNVRQKDSSDTITPPSSLSAKQQASLTDCCVLIKVNCSDKKIPWAKGMGIGHSREKDENDPIVNIRNTV